MDMDKRIMQMVDEAAANRIKELEAALRAIINELGEPQPGYIAPVANAARIARKALEGR